MSHDPHGLAGASDGDRAVILNQNDGLTLTQTGSTLTIELRCGSVERALMLRDVILGGVLDNGEFTVFVGKAAVKAMEQK